MFSKYQLFSVLKYWYYNNPSLQLPCLPRYVCRISPWPTETPLQHNHHHVLHQFPNFFLPHSTTRHNFWIYQTICQAMLIKFIIKLYTNHNTLLVKHATYQKGESLTGASLSKLDNTVNSNFIFNTKYLGFSTKWYVIFHFHNPTCAYRHPTISIKNPLPHFSYFLHTYSDYTSS